MDAAHIPNRFVEAPEFLGLGKVFCRKTGSITITVAIAAHDNVSHHMPWVIVRFKSERKIFVIVIEPGSVSGRP